MVIKFYGNKGPLGYLSNFYPAEVQIGGVRWPTTEHYYQAMKSLDPAEQQRIKEARHPAAAKRLGKGVTQRPDWESVKESFMLEGLRAKFTQHPDLAEKLISTGTEELVENSPTDSYWGCGPDGQGLNRLGHLLMQVRSELRGEGTNEETAPVPSAKELKMYSYNKEGTSTPITKGVLFISRPVTMYGGKLAPGPTSRFFPHKAFTYGLMEKDRCHLGLEDFAVYTADGIEPEVVRKVTKNVDVSQPPFGTLVFATLDDEGVADVRRSLLREFAKDHPNGGFVWVGAALLTKSLAVGSGGKPAYSFHVKEAVWVTVPLSQVISKGDLSDYTSQFMDWLDENLTTTASTAASTEVVTMTLGTEVAADAQVLEDEDTLEDEVVESNKEYNTSSSKLDLSGVEIPNREFIYATMRSPLYKAYEARNGAELELGVLGLNGEEFNPNFERLPFPEKVALELAAALTKASGRKVQAGKGKGKQAKPKLYPLVCLLFDELDGVLTWLAEQLDGVMANSPEGPVKALTYEDGTLTVGDRKFIIRPEGVFLPDGRILSHVVVATWNYSSRKYDTQVISSFGWFALHLAANLERLITWGSFGVGKDLAGKLPFSAKSGSAGGVEDADRLRWEGAQFTVQKWNGKFFDLKTEPMEKVRVCEEAVRKFGLVPILNGNLVCAHMVMCKQGDDGWIFFTRKLTKLVKRISQQNPVVAGIEEPELKRSVLFTHLNNDEPTRNVWSVPTCIALTLIMPPGAIINLGHRKQILNRLVFEATPTYEVSADPDYLQVMPATVVDPKTGKGGYKEGDTLALVKLTNGEQVEILCPTDCIEPEFTVTPNTDYGYRRIDWRLVVHRREDAIKGRGTLKGIFQRFKINITEGTNAHIVVPSDADKSKDGLLAILDYVCQTAFHPANAGNEFCQELKKRFLAMNKLLFAEVFGEDTFPTEWAVLTPDFRDEYEVIIRKFWDYFGTAKTFWVECTEEYAQVMMRLRVTEDGQPIDGWHRLTEEEMWEPQGSTTNLPVKGGHQVGVGRRWKLGDLPNTELYADGDVDDIHTNIIGIARKDGKLYFVQRCFVLDERDGAQVFWPVKAEYSTIRQAVGTSRAMTGQVLAAISEYPTLEEEWLNAGLEDAKARAEIVKTFYNTEGLPRFDEVVVCKGDMAEAVKDLPPKVLITGKNPTTGEETSIGLAVHAITKMSGEGIDQLSLPELLRLVLGSTDHGARYAAIRRMHAVMTKTFGGTKFWKGAMGPRGVCGRVMGLPHIPLHEVWIRESRQADSIYRKAIKIFGKAKVDGLKVLMARPPLPVMCPLQVRIIRRGDANYKLLHPEIIYINALTQAFNGGDFDGDSVYVYEGDQEMELLSLDMLLENMRQRTGTDQLAAKVGDGVRHGGEYLGDWYEIKKPMKLIAGRDTAFSVTSEQMVKIMTESEEQQTLMVGSMYTTGFVALCQGHPLALPTFDLYEKVLGGYEPSLFAVWKQQSDALKQEENADPTNYWADATVMDALKKELRSLMASAAISRLADDKGLPVEEAKPYALVRISRGIPNVQVLEGFRNQNMLGNTLMDKLIKVWIDTLLDAFLAYLGKAPTPPQNDEDEGEGGLPKLEVRGPSPTPSSPAAAAPEPTPAPAPAPATPVTQVGHGLVLVPNTGVTDERYAYLERILERTDTAHLTTFADSSNLEEVKKVVRARLGNEIYAGELLENCPERPPVTVVATKDVIPSLSAFANEFLEGALVVVDEDDYQPQPFTILLLFLNGKEQQDDIELAMKASKKGIPVKVIPVSPVGYNSEVVYILCGDDRGKAQVREVMIQAIQNGRAVACRDKMVLDVAMSMDVPVLFEGEEPVLHHNVMVERGSLFWMYAGSGDAFVIGDYDPSVVDRLRRETDCRRDKKGTLQMVSISQEQEHEEVILAVTGHRPDKLWGYDYSHPKWQALKEILKQKILQYGATKVISGMALGVDTIFAQAAIELGIPVAAAIPCRNHERTWKPESQKLYHEILNHPLVTKYLVTDAPYRAELMQIRNEWMVDRCDRLIAVWNGASGGTANCVAYAKKEGCPIDYIDPSRI